MSYQSIIVQTMNMVATQVAGLGITFAIPPATPVLVPVVMKYLPRRWINQDPSTLITVWRTDQPEKIQYVGFKGKQWVTFLIYVSIVTPSNQDLSSYLDTFSYWRQEIAGLFELNGPNEAQLNAPPLFGITNLFEVRVVPDVFLTRQQLNLLMTYNTIGLQFRCQGA